MTDVDWGPVAVWAGAFASFLAVFVALLAGVGLVLAPGSAVAAGQFRAGPALLPAG